MLLFPFSLLIPPFFSGIVGCGSAYLMLRITRAHNERKAGEGDEKTWRESRLAAETSVRQELATLQTAFAERKKSADAEKMADKLKFEADLAAVAQTLSRLADVADKQTTMIERVGWQGKEIDRLDREVSELHSDIKNIQKDINDLYRAKP